MQITHNEFIDNITGVLLAGGKSLRMGHDKARIEINGQLYEAAAWGLGVDEAFQVVNNSSIDLACFPKHMRHPDDQRVEWEWCELAYFHNNIEMIYWLPWGEA